MSEEKKKYIYNKHYAPIIVHTRDGNGKILETITFSPKRTDVISGRVITTGYTPLSEAKYEELCKVSSTFQQYKDKLKLLVVQDDLPPEAKTPHEALVDARRAEREALAKIAILEAEIVTLKASLLDAETKYKTLESASTSDEKLKPLNDQIASLTTKNSQLVGFAEGFVEQLGQLAQNNKVNQADVKQFAEKTGKVCKDLTQKFKG